MGFTNVQQAQKLLAKIVNLPINTSPIPQGTKRVFPVAVLSTGNMLLSDGSTRQTPMVDQIQKLANDVAVQGPAAQNTPESYMSNKTLNIAVPAEQTGQNESDRTLALVGYLNKILQPKMAASPEMGLPAMVPQMQQPQDMQNQLTSALANLPQLQKPVENVFAQENNQQFQNLLSAIQKFQAGWQQQFARQITPGDFETNNTGQYSLPLVQGYGNNYRLPTASNAQYAQVSSNPFVLTNVIR